ncbi:uncharacterized protein LOC133283717 [Gastrolobium bilobum]|uniref:uncharacterized protein LOC133283717 n=1 Tax=Gastrolobium bilobum TaxID=150636 RepID=UPI002AB107B9|nr:uncharacterized protein LOC133283717 [Gastrolobium bilobum]
MILTSQHLFAYSPSTYSLCITRTNCSLSLSIAPITHFRIPKLNLFGLQKLRSFTTRAADPFHLEAHESEGTVQKRVVVDFDFDFDTLLSLLELSCLVSSAIVSVGLAASGSKNGFLVAIGNRVVVVCGILMLVGGVLVGAWVRGRQWRRICRERVKGGLVERIEKLEDELKSSVTVIRVLSRQIEKLGTRFRVTRQALKDPITESAALAQKNSEATRALAVQSDILEKELGEIQKVLLAMQEQQQKQLDLILAIGKTGKLWESKRRTSEEQDTLEVP